MQIRNEGTHEEIFWYIQIKQRDFPPHRLFKCLNCQNDFHEDDS